jgi:hypothetical protein
MEYADGELAIFELRRKVAESCATWSSQVDDEATKQFRQDFEQLAFYFVNQDWHLPPEPHNSLQFAPFRTTPIPRRLPFGPLRRMVRFFEIEILKYLLRMGSDESFARYRLVLRDRLLTEMPDAGARKTSTIRNVKIIEFGNLVLGYENAGIARGHALRMAATEMGRFFTNKNDRTLFRWFKEFARLCQRRGYVLESGIGLLGRAKPRFPLSKAARARAGAKRNNDIRPK